MEDIKRKVNICTDNLLGSKTIDGLRGNEVTIEEIDLGNNYFAVGQTKVYVRVDLLYSVNGHHFIVDWKTGKESVDLSQLALYGLYVRGAYG